MKLTQLSLVAFFALLLIAVLSVYSVDEREKAVVLRLGALVQQDVAPGLHLKVPIIDKVLRFEGTVQSLDAPVTKYLTSDREYLELDAYIIWRIENVPKFYTSTNGKVKKAKKLLEERAVDVLKSKVAKLSMQEVISGEREALMRELTQEVASSAKTELGVRVIDIRIKRVDYPKETISDVYDEMRRDLNKEAQLYRAEGTREATKIKAEANKQAEILLAEGYSQAEMLKGEGDGLAAAIYAKAYQKDAEFYAFYRSMTAYEKAFSQKTDVLLVSPDSEFFGYMQKSR